MNSGKLIEMNSEKKLYESVVSYKILVLEQNVPFLIKAVPVVKLKRRA